tara:strand:+ start:1662 stop:1856 length:195 start_codon:yes stop_codon:yes gene_type:complete
LAENATIQNEIEQKKGKPDISIPVALITSRDLWNRIRDFWWMLGIIIVLIMGIIAVIITGSPNS